MKSVPLLLKRQEHKSKVLQILFGRRQKHTILVVQGTGKIKINKKEIKTLGFYPLGKSEQAKRDALKKNMHPYTIMALDDFMNNHTPESYHGSDELKIKEEVFHQFHDLIKNIV